MPELHVRVSKMRNTPLLKWGNNNNNKQAGKQGNRNWIHSPDALQRGHIAYLVKFLGSTEVDQPKGINVVKEGIRKLRFTQQLRKAEGSKTPKVELTISIDGVAIQEVKTKRIMHQYPLHRISYCADDKGEKKFFSFIAKEADSEKHVCFVFVSDKLAEEITLTIGQAFDLAYRRFLETSGKDLEVQRRLVALTQHSCRLEQEKNALVQRLSDIANLNLTDVKDYMARQGLTDLASVPVVNTPGPNPSPTSTPTSSSDSSSCYQYDTSPPGNNTSSNFTSSSTGTNSPHMNGEVMLLNLTNSSSSSNGTSPSSGAGTSGASLLSSPTMQTPGNAPPIPPRPNDKKPFGDDFVQDMMSPMSQPSVGTKLQGLLLDEIDEDFNPRATESTSNISSALTSTPFSTNGVNNSSPAPLLAPPPSKQSVVRRPQPSLTPTTNGNMNGSAVDLFGSSPMFGNTNGNGNDVGKAGGMQRATAPTKMTSDDPFGMGDFDGMTGVDGSQREIENAIGFLDKRLLEMKDGFSRGLTFGNEDFSLESLDPLRN